MHAGYYFHIEPNTSFVGGGIYMPDADRLKAIREYIAENGEEFLAITNNKSFKKVFHLTMNILICFVINRSPFQASYANRKFWQILILSNWFNRLKHYNRLTCF